MIPLSEAEPGNFPTNSPNCGANRGYSGAIESSASRDHPKERLCSMAAQRRCVITDESRANIRAPFQRSPMNEHFGWLQKLRTRGLFQGFGYALTVVLALMVAWDLDTFIYQCFANGPLAALKAAGWFWLLLSAHQLPTVPMLTAGINLAPQSGVRRYAWLFMVGAGVWGFCTLFFTIEDRTFDPNLQYGLMVAFILSACVYRSSARTRPRG